MDLCAEFTLRAARLVQEYNNTWSSMAGWLILPEFRAVTWTQAGELLGSMPKPVIVAPLRESGLLAYWEVAKLEPAQRDHIQRHLANQVEYVCEKLKLCGLSENDKLSLVAMGWEFRMTVSEFQRWTREFVIALGFTIMKSRNPHEGQIVIMPPGGGQPLGMRESELAPPDHHHSDTCDH